MRISHRSSATRAVSFTDLSTTRAAAARRGAWIGLLRSMPGALPSPLMIPTSRIRTSEPDAFDNADSSIRPTLDVRYIGTLARKQLGGMDLNTSTVYYNPELFNALEVTRAGGNDPLFDQMFAGIRLSGVPTTVPVVDGIDKQGIGPTASEHGHASKSRQRELCRGGERAHYSPDAFDRCGRLRNHRSDSGAGVCDSAQRLRSPCQWPDEYTDPLLPGELPDRQSSTECRDLHRQSRPQQLPRAAGFLYPAAHAKVLPSRPPTALRSPCSLEEAEVPGIANAGTAGGDLEQTVIRIR